MGSREAEEGIKLVWVFFHLFIYMEMVYFLLFFSLFATLGHLGVCPLASYITNFNS